MPLMPVQAGESSNTYSLRPLQVERVRAYFIGLGLTAVLLTLCFPAALPGMSSGWWLLAHIALVPAAMVAIRAGGSKRLIWTSYLVAWVWWLVMVRWLIPVTGIGYVVLAGFLAIYFPACLIVLRLLIRHIRLPASLAVPMAWVSLELLRESWPAGGFGWFLLGHSQAPLEAGRAAGLMIQVADILGVHGVSFLVAMTNGLIVDWLSLSVIRRGPGGYWRLNSKLTAATVMWSVSLAAVLIYGFYRIVQVEAATNPSLRIAVVQTAVSQSNKICQDPDQMEADWRRLLALTRKASAAKPPVDLVIWPETVVPASINSEAVAYYREQAEIWAMISGRELATWPNAGEHREQARRLGLPFEDLPRYQAEQFRRVASFDDRIASLIRNEVKTSLLVGSSSALLAEPPRRFNSVFLYRSDGIRATRRYDKIHRVPFGEYIPWVEKLPWLKGLFLRYLSPYDHDYTLTPGRGTTVFEMDRRGVDSVRLVTPICFEDTDGRLCRRMFFDTRGTKRADILANLTNDAWFQPPQRPQHLQIAVFRSVENRVPTARSVNMGVSGFISATGRIGPNLPWRGPNACGEGIVVHQVGICGMATIFGWIGHLPALVMAILTFGLTILALVDRIKNR